MAFSKPESTSSNKIETFTRSCPCFARIYHFTSSGSAAKTAFSSRKLVKRQPFCSLFCCSMLFLIQSADLCAPSEIRTRTVAVLSRRPLPVGLSGQNTGQTIPLSTHPHPPNDFPKAFLNGGQGRARTGISTRNFLIYDLSNMSKNFSLVILYKRFQRILRKENHFFQETETGLEPA